MRQNLHWPSCLKLHAPRPFQKQRRVVVVFLQVLCVGLFPCGTQGGHLHKSPLWRKWQTDLKSVDCTHYPVCVQTNFRYGFPFLQCSVRCRQNADKGKFITAFKSSGHAHTWNISLLLIGFCISDNSVVYLSRNVLLI